MRAMPSGVIASILIAAAVLAPAPTRAQPQAPDFTGASVLYRAAEEAMAAGRHADAVRDYTAAYEITRDPVLFYKLGVAHEKAGACDVALTFYRRYLQEGNPAPTFVEQTGLRIVACGGTPTLPEAAAASAKAPAPTPGSATPEPSEPIVEAPPPVAAPDAGSALTGSAVAPGSHGPRSAWLLVAGSIGFVTIGAVLAYSANSSEADISDLYVGLGGRRPTYNMATQARYEELVAQGERYQHLSWTAFGVAGAAAIGAAILFVRHDGRESVGIAPILTPQGAGATASWRF